MNNTVIRAWIVAKIARKWKMSSIKGIWLSAHLTQWNIISIRSYTEWRMQGLRTLYPRMSYRGKAPLCRLMYIHTCGLPVSCIWIYNYACAPGSVLQTAQTGSTSRRAPDLATQRLIDTPLVMTAFDIDHEWMGRGWCVWVR